MKYKVTLNGRTYEVEVEAGTAMCTAEYEAYAPAATPVADASTAPVASAPTAPSTGSQTSATPVRSTTGEAVKAPMPGTILKVAVTVGQTVEVGTVLVILEAMKMENEIVAPKAGTVVQVLVQKGATVDTDALLIVIE